MPKQVQNSGQPCLGSHVLLATVTASAVLAAWYYYMSNIKTSSASPLTKTEIKTYIGHFSPCKTLHCFSQQSPVGSSGPGQHPKSSLLASLPPPCSPKEADYF